MTRFLFDQNAPLASVLRLREAGHEVAQVESGEPDSAVLERARLESRIVVTYDRDFGFLVFRTHMPLPRLASFTSGRSRQQPLPTVLAAIHGDCARMLLHDPQRFAPRQQSAPNS